MAKYYRGNSARELPAVSVTLVTSMKRTTKSCCLFCSRYSDPLDIGGTLYIYDTTAYVNTDYLALLNAVRTRLKL